jgi:hypothetical protein
MIRISTGSVRLRTACATMGWLLVACAGRAAVTNSLATDFVEVLVEGIPPASRYVLDTKPVVVQNRSDTGVHLRYDAVVPQPEEMRAGYEPIPDAAWIGFEPRVFDLPPGGTASGRVVVYAPADPALAGRRFQAMLHLHSDPGAGSLLSIGLKPRLLFSIAGGAAPSGPRVENTPRPLAWIKPYAAAAPAGCMLFQAEPFTVENYWDEPMTYDIRADRDAARHVDLRPGETALPDPAWIEVAPSTIVLPPYGRAEVRAAARIPIAGEHFGRTYLAALHAVARRPGHPPVDAYNAVRIVIPDPGRPRD